jgi:hypothetical protein
VVELQSGDTAVVSTDLAAAARLGDENSLDLPAPLRHPLLGATLAAVARTAVQPKPGVAVTRAFQLDLLGCVGWQWRLASTVRSRNVPLPKPMPNSCNRSVKCIGNLPQARPVTGEALEKLSIRSPPCGESSGAGRPEPVLSGPVGDCGRVLTGLPADLFQGLPSLELLCQPSPLHEHMFPPASDDSDAWGQTPSPLGLCSRARSSRPAQSPGP